VPIRYYSNEFQVIQTAHRPETFRSILSGSLKDNLDPLNRRRLLAEHQVEMFYNFHITPWMRLTGDFQIIRPTRPIATTAIVPGMRLVFIF
jgi:hypothetical protein